MKRLLAAVPALLLVAVACSGAAEVVDTSLVPTNTTTTTEQLLPTAGPPSPDMSIESPAFAESDVIPVRFTCDGADVSPELHVLNPPSGTITMAIIVDDPDAPVGVWDHWVEYDIPNTEETVQVWEEGVPLLGVPGVNSWNITGYGGPCPPGGQNHRYFFTVFALDAELLIPEGVDSATLREAMEGHVLAEAQLIGTYSR